MFLLTFIISNHLQNRVPPATIKLQPKIFRKPSLVSCQLKNRQLIIDTLRWVVSVFPVALSNCDQWQWDEIVVYRIWTKIRAYMYHIILTIFNKLTWFHKKPLKWNGEKLKYWIIKHNVLRKYLNIQLINFFVYDSAYFYVSLL